MSHLAVLKYLALWDVWCLRQHPATCPACVAGAPALASITEITEAEIAILALEETRNKKRHFSLRKRLNPGS